MIESHEDRARAKKATKLFLELVAAGVTDIDTVRGFSGPERKAMCAWAHVPDASDRTWSAVLGMLQAFTEDADRALGRLNV